MQVTPMAATAARTGVRTCARPPLSHYSAESAALWRESRTTEDVYLTDLTDALFPTVTKADWTARKGQRQLGCGSL